MTESCHYTEEDFELSYESNQKVVRRLIIKMRAAKGLSVVEMADKIGVEKVDLNDMELGEKRIRLLDFAKIMDACGFLDEDI